MISLSLTLERKIDHCVLFYITNDNANFIYY